MGVRVAETMKTGGSAPDMVGLLGEDRFPSSRGDLARPLEPLYSARMSGRVPRSARARAVAQIAMVVVVASVGAAVACGSSDGSATPEPDGGGEDGAVSVQGCPTP